MKKIFILIVLVIVIIGCVDGGQCYTSSVKIINNSGKDIEVSSYKNEYVNGSVILTKIFSKKTILKNNENIYKADKACAPDFAKAPSFGSLFDGDSIIIDYGDRVMEYSDGPPKTANDLNRNPFVLFRNNQPDKHFIYTLSPDDYTNAKVK